MFFSSINSPLFLTDHNGVRHEPGTRSLRDALGGAPDAQLLSFVEACLQWDPEERLTPSKALKHAFLVETPPSAFEKSLLSALPPIQGAVRASSAPHRTSMASEAKSSFDSEASGARFSLPQIVVVHPTITEED